MLPSCATRPGPRPGRRPPRPSRRAMPTPARRSTSTSACSATARRATARGRGRSTCCPGRATSRGASTRSGRRRTRRRPTRTSSRSSPTGCPGPPCRRGRFFLRRTGGTSSPTSRPSRRTSLQGGAQEARAAEGGRVVGGLDQARQGDVRGDRVPQVPRHRRARPTARRASELKDEWGHPIAPANLTKRWTFRGGAGRTEIATRLANGVLGTPMPAFLDAVEKPEDIWHLTNFILSLGPGAAALRDAGHGRLGVGGDSRRSQRRVLEEDRRPATSRSWARSSSIRATSIRSIDLVSVRAAYNDKEVAFHLTWDDPTESKGDGKQTFPDAIALQFPPQITAGHRAAVLPDGRRLATPCTCCAGSRARASPRPARTGRPSSRRSPAAKSAGKVVFANGQYRLVIKRPLAAKGEGAPDLPAGGVHAGRVPGVGRRSGGDGTEDVADLVVLSAAGGAAVEPAFRHSSRRGNPHAGGHDPRRPRGESRRDDVAHDRCDRRV